MGGSGERLAHSFCDLFFSLGILVLSWFAVTVGRAEHRAAAALYNKIRACAACFLDDLYTPVVEIGGTWFTK